MIYGYKEKVDRTADYLRRIDLLDRYSTTRCIIHLRSSTYDYLKLEDLDS